ncbi:MAG TPA: ABC transporter permease [Streptosporangiaceae bacterium]|jgi:ABC-2 type transport system permease protein
MPADQPDQAIAGAGAAAAGGGVIHDIGYRRYRGERLGRAQIGAALCWHSLRTAFGIGRGARAKIVPAVTFGIMCLPAVVDAVIVARSPAGTRAVSYDTYVPALRILVMIVFLSAQAPELVSRDLRSRVLPLYFARPVRRLDYPAAKLAALVLACLAMLGIPLLLLYLGTIAQAHGGGAVWAQTTALIPGLLVAALWSVLLAPIALAISSLTARRAIAAGGVAIFFLLTWTLARLLVAIVSRTAAAGPGAGPPAAAQLYALISPFTVLDGVRQWLGGTTPGVIASPGRYGPAFGAAALAFLLTSLGLLTARYRKAGLG